MGFRRARQGGGEADECTCAQCRGVDLGEWLLPVGDHDDQRQDTLAG